MARNKLFKVHGKESGRAPVESRVTGSRATAALRHARGRGQVTGTTSERGLSRSERGNRIKKGPPGPGRKFRWMNGSNVCLLWFEMFINSSDKPQTEKRSPRSKVQTDSQASALWLKQDLWTSGLITIIAPLVNKAKLESQCQSCLWSRI